MEKRLALIGYFVLELIFDRAVMGPPAHPGKRKTELNRKGFTGCGKTRCGPGTMIGPGQDHPASLETNILGLCPHLVGDSSFSPRKSRHAAN
jgi:hypothetical protein